MKKGEKVLLTVKPQCKSGGFISIAVVVVVAILVRISTF